MKKGILNKNKRYVVLDKKKRIILELDCTRAAVDYWRYEEIHNDTKEGTKMWLTTIIPRIAGSDFFVDHGGEVLEKCVVIPFGERIALEAGFIWNPQTAEFEMDERLTLKEK